MVYMGNIIRLHTELNEEQEIILKFGGELQVSILPDDTLEKVNGDLKIYRSNPDCAVIVDCEEVKYVIKKNRWF